MYGFELNEQNIRIIIIHYNILAFIKTVYNNQSFSFLKQTFNMIVNT